MKCWIIIFAFLMLFGCKTNYFIQEIPQVQSGVSSFGRLATQLLELKYEECSVNALANGDAIDAYRYFGRYLCRDDENLGLSMLNSGMARIFLLVVPERMQSKYGFKKAYAFVRLWPEHKEDCGFYYRTDFLIYRKGEPEEEIVGEFEFVQGDDLGFYSAVVTTIF